jgi:hypothetical protein
MTINLYNYYSKDNIENVFCWLPNQELWWITGFNPTFNRPDVNKMVSLGSIDFIGREDMYDQLKISVESDSNLKDFMIFDEDGHTIWLIWWDTDNLYLYSV